MEHHKKFRKFGKTADYRKAFIWNLVRSLLLQGRIKTTTARAKEIRSFSEKVITRAKNDTLANRRLMLAKFDAKTVKKLFSELAPLYKDRPGGYTRILKWGNRKNDAAPVSIVELVK